MTAIFMTSPARRRLDMRAITGALLVSMLVIAIGQSVRTAASPSLHVIVQSTDARAAITSVHDAGGTIGRALPIIDGFAASIPATAMDELSAAPGVRAVTIDRVMKPMGLLGGLLGGGSGSLDSGALSVATRVVGAQSLWAAGITGRGVDVALIDTGVTPVPGIQSSQLIDGPDLSFDSQGPNQYIDEYGHGTHMAGIISGHDAGVTASATGCTTCLNSSGFSDTTKFVGVAPEARIVNVKVGAFDGATDVSQVIAAIDWVVEHKNDNGMNIRVLNLSFGTDSAQSYRVDPLAYAAEVAWRKGIFVVAASGNDGSSTQTLADPASDPFLFAVGADDPRGTVDAENDSVPDWAQRGTNDRHVDVVAPGVHVNSLDVPGSYVDTNYPTVRSGRFLRGSGTSQAAAVASGAAALMFQKYPTASPDSVKAALRSTAHKMGGILFLFQGEGVIDVKAAASTSTLHVASAQSWTKSTGTGSLEQSRGSAHVAIDDQPLTGEKDIFGNAWNGQRWSADAWAGTSWNGGVWEGQRWSGDSWSGQRWSGAAWDGNTWTGQRWSGQRWSGMTWDGQRWSGSGWDGQRWSGQRWSGNSFDGQRWSGASWS